MSKLTNLPERALDLASSVGDNLRHVVPSAGKWLETGAKLGALRGGVRVATAVARRNPVIVAAAAAGAGLLWYAAHRRAKRAEAGENADGSINGTSRRVEARAGNGRAAPRKATARKRTSTRTRTSAE